MAYHWTTRLTKTEAKVMKKFVCSSEWMKSFSGEDSVTDLEESGSPLLLDEMLAGDEEHEALCSLEGKAYVWPLGDGRWGLDEYGLPIWLTLNGIESSCTVELV